MGVLRRPATAAQVKQTQLQPPPCFLDYFAEGARLSLMFAVDFSGSNPDPSSPSCMHHTPPSGYSACELAFQCVADIAAVGPILHHC